jgi:hypothetical protein
MFFAQFGIHAGKVIAFGVVQYRDFWVIKNEEMGFFMPSACFKMMLTQADLSSLYYRSKKIQFSHQGAL